jgi:ATP-binding cassette subfamily F protein 3
LTDALEQFEGAVFIVTHSEEILRRLATRLVVFQGDAPFVFEGTYEEFLESVGWDEEQGVDPSASVRKNKKNKGGGKDVKKEKAELLQERSRLLTPIRKEIERCEERITSLEAQISTSSARLADVSEKGNAALIRSTTHELADLKRELDAVMASWESASERATSIEKEFEGKLDTSPVK